MAEGTVRDLADLQAEIRALLRHLDARGLGVGERIAVLSVALTMGIEASPTSEEDRKRLLIDAGLLMRLRLSSADPSQGITAHHNHPTQQ